MAWDHERERSPALLKKPGAHAKTADLTFTRADAYDLARRLGRLYPFLVPDNEAAEDLAKEYEAQFDGYPVIEVDRAVTKALAKCATGTAPTPGKIHAELHKPEARPSDRHYRPVYDYSTLPANIAGEDWARKLMKMGCHPSYIKFSDRDRWLTQDMVAKVQKMATEDLKRLGIDDRSIGEAKRIMSGSYDKRDLA